MGSLAMIQCLMGIRCKEFTMIASDQTAFKSVFILKDDEDKILPMGDHVIMAVSGEPGDILQFTQFIAKNLALYKLRNGYQLDIGAIVHFTRSTLVQFSRNILVELARGNLSWMMNFLIGGWDEESGGQLFSMDYTAASVSVPFAAHGIGGMFCMSILEHHYRPDMTESQAYEVIQMCVKEIHARLNFNLPNFQVKVISKNGITSLPIISTPREVASPRLVIVPSLDKPTKPKKST